jgi:hypothetical protein
VDSVGVFMHPSHLHTGVLDYQPPPIWGSLQQSQVCAQSVGRGGGGNMPVIVLPVLYMSSVPYLLYQDTALISFPLKRKGLELKGRPPLGTHLSI